MEKKKVLKVILIIFIIIILSFFVNLGRKTAILMSIENKREKTNEIDNIYYKDVKISDDSSIIVENFRKGDISKQVAKFYDKDDALKIKAEAIILETPEEAREYFTSEGEKSLFIYETKGRTYRKENVEKHTFIENMRYAMNSKITTKNYNGEKCYVIEGKYTPYTVGYEYLINTTAYVSKDTGIKVKFSVTSNLVSINQFGEAENRVINTSEDTEYKINSVTDEDMKEPDRSEYVLRETNNGMIQ